MEIIKSKTLTEVKNNTCYLGCTFYLEKDKSKFGDITTERLVNSTFENCSFRSEISIGTLEKTTFLNCNFVYLEILQMIDSKVENGFIDQLVYCTTGPDDYMKSIRPYHLSKLAIGGSYLPPEIPQNLNITDLFMSIENDASPLTQVTNLTTLETLEITSWSINVHMKYLPKLTTLKMSGSAKIIDVSWEGLEFLKNLTFEFVSGETKVIQQIRSLSKLEKLSIKNCWFREILPVEIFGCKELTHLILNQNRISYIPKEIGDLENLQELNLADNQISRLPKSMFFLRKLSSLDLSDNKIETIPREISFLTNLKHLNIAGNKINEKQLHFLLKALNNCTINV